MDGLHWANDPRQASMAETLLWRAMQRHDLRMLATYVAFLMEKGVDLEPMYDRARQEFPETPTLSDLQEKIATAHARQV